MLGAIVRVEAQEAPQLAPGPATIVLDLVDNTTRTQLERADVLLAQGQWPEVVETLRQMVETGGEKLVLVSREPTSASDGFRRFVAARTFGQMRLADLSRTAPAALALYREQVDPVARRLLERGVDQGDESALRQLTERFLMSSYGDDALLLLGEMALERGEWTAARGYWERINPRLRFPSHAAAELQGFAGQPLWLLTRHLDSADGWREAEDLLKASPERANWLVYPDTNLELAAVQARLVLVSILEGHVARARVELDLLRQLFPNERGELAGRAGMYVDLVHSLLEQSQQWPVVSPDEASWPMFAGNAQRHRVASTGFELGGSPRWQVELPQFSGAGELFGSEGQRVAEATTGLLSYHPIVVNGVAILQIGATDSNFVARRLTDGERVFGQEVMPATVLAAPGLPRSVGVPRFPLAANQQTVYARIGSLPTGTRTDTLREREPPARILGLDVADEGRRVLEVSLDGPPWDDDWALDSVPVSDGQFLYVVLRHRSAVRSDVHVASFDSRSGRLRWRQRIVGGETAGADRPFELTHTLLTLGPQAIYCNTNLGVVAALRPDNGELMWLTEYPRLDLRDQNPDRDARPLFRDLNPCLLHRDLVVVAPMDCDRIFALDANTGGRVWSSLPGQGADAIHLLGVGAEHLIASGDYLYWFDVTTGELLSQFPAPRRFAPGQAKPSPCGYGRGLLAGQHIYWPTREAILVFDQRTQRGEFGGMPELIREIPLVPRGAMGGNLVLVDDSLLITTANRLFVFDAYRTPVATND